MTPDFQRPMTLLPMSVPLVPSELNIMLPIFWLVPPPGEK